MQVPKFFRRSLYILGGMIAVVILVLAVLAFVQIPLDLTKHKGLLESAATRAIGRTVKVDEKIGVTTSLRPVFTLEGLRIGNPKDFQTGDFAQMKSAALAGKPFTLSIKGTLFQHPFTTAVKAGSLEELLEESRSWMEIRMDIAETRFDLTGDINISEANTKLQMKASVKGDRLDSLDELLKLDLPPFESYGASALFTMRKKHYELSDLEVYVRESKLTGGMVLDSSGTRPVATIELIAPAIQLDDFDLGDWSPEEGDSEAPIRAEAKSKEIADGATNRAKETPVMSTGGE